MKFGEIFERYALSDCNTLSFQLNYVSKQFTVKLEVKRILAKRRFEPCLIELEFKLVSEIYIFEDFPTDGGCTDVTFVKLNEGSYYLSLDPYGNSGAPHEEDNLVIRAGALTLIDEEGVRQIIT